MSEMRESSSSSGQIATQGIPDAEAARWPSMKLAYEFVIPSYDILERRLQAVEGRIQSLLTLGLSVTLGAAAIVGAINQRVEIDWPFGVAIAFLIAIIGAGAHARRMGGFHAFNLDAMWNYGVASPEWDFQREALDSARRDLAVHVRAFQRKNNALTFMMVMLAGEIAFLTVWAFQQMGAAVPFTL